MGKAAGYAYSSSISPSEGNLVERLRPEALGRARHHAAAQGPVEFGRGIVIRQRPDDHALEAALHQVAAGCGEQATPEAETLEFRTQIQLVNLAVEMQAAGAVAAVVGIARDLVAEDQNADTATLADRAVPTL